MIGDVIGRPLALTVLTSSQGLLIAASKANGVKYDYAVTSANCTVETTKMLMSLLALVKIWRAVGVNEDNPTQHELVGVVGVSDSGGVVFSEELVAVLCVFVRGRAIVSDFKELEHHIDWDFV